MTYSDTHIAFLADYTRYELSEIEASWDKFQEIKSDDFRDFCRLILHCDAVSFTLLEAFLTLERQSRYLYGQKEEEAQGEPRETQDGTGSYTTD